jgi:hypothetical protein
MMGSFAHHSSLIAFKLFDKESPAHGADSTALGSPRKGFGALSGFIGLYRLYQMFARRFYEASHGQANS